MKRSMMLCGKYMSRPVSAKDGQVNIKFFEAHAQPRERHARKDVLVTERQASDCYIPAVDAAGSHLGPYGDHPV